MSMVNQITRKPRAREWLLAAVCALITITPPSAPRRTLPRDVTFVVDVSGSMRGIKLAQAKKAGHALLESLGGNGCPAKKKRLALPATTNAPPNLRCTASSLSRIITAN